MGKLSVLALAMTADAPHAPRRPESESRFVRWTTVAGGVIGLGLDLFYLFTIQSGYAPSVGLWTRIAVIGSSSLIQIGAAIAAGWLLGELIVKIKPSWWQAGLAGPVYGAFAGALITGLTIGTVFAVGIPTGAITMSPDAALFPPDPTWLGAFAGGFLGGATFGAIFGAIAGTVITPTAAIIYTRSTR